MNNIYVLCFDRYLYETLDGLFSFGIGSFRLRLNQIYVLLFCRLICFSRWLSNSFDLLKIMRLFMGCLLTWKCVFFDSKIFGDLDSRVGLKKRLSIVFEYSTLLLDVKGKVISDLKISIFIFDGLWSLTIFCFGKFLRSADF